MNSPPRPEANLSDLHYTYLKAADCVRSRNFQQVSLTRHTLSRATYHSKGKSNLAQKRTSWKSYDLALLSVSTKHSLTRILA